MFSIITPFTCTKETVNSLQFHFTLNMYVLLFQLLECTAPPTRFPHKTCHPSLHHMPPLTPSHVTPHSITCHPSLHHMSPLTPSHVTPHSITNHPSLHHMSPLTPSHVTPHSITYHPSLHHMSPLTPSHVTPHSITYHSVTCSLHEPPPSLHVRTTTHAKHIVHKLCSTSVQ